MLHWIGYINVLSGGKNVNRKSARSYRKYTIEAERKRLIIKSEYDRRILPLFSDLLAKSKNMNDPSNGYEGVAEQFIAGRGRAVNGIGASTARTWAKTLAAGSVVLDVGCGTGVPVSKILLEEGLNIQRILIRKMAAALNPGGKLLFTATVERHEWKDIMTKQDSWSLGAEAYREMIVESGLALGVEYRDEVGNHYFAGIRQNLH